MHQFPAEVMPLQESSGGLNRCPSISTAEKISISLRPGLGLRSPIVERNYPLFSRVILPLRESLVQHTSKDLRDSSHAIS